MSLRLIMLTGWGTQNESLGNHVTKLKLNGNGNDSLYSAGAEGEAKAWQTGPPSAGAARPPCKTTPAT